MTFSTYLLFCGAAFLCSAVWTVWIKVWRQK